MPRRDFLGIYARELELTAELHAHEAHRRYALAHEERRNFYSAYSAVSQERHAKLCRILSNQFAKATRAEARSHSTTNKLRGLRSRFLHRFAMDNRMGYASSATMRLHAPFVRSASPPVRGHIEEMGSTCSPMDISRNSHGRHGIASNNELARERYQVATPTQNQRNGAAKYWYSRANRLGVEEQSALHSMQQYLSGERDEEVSDLLRQHAMEVEQDAADDQERREEQAYRVLAEDTLRQESEQRKASGKSVSRSLEQGQDSNPGSLQETAASQTGLEDNSRTIKNLTWEVEELKRKVALLSMEDGDNPNRVSQLRHHSSTESSDTPYYSRRHRAYIPAEGEAGPSNWLCAEPEEYNDWFQAGPGATGRISLPRSSTYSYSDAEEHGCSNGYSDVEIDSQ